MFKAYVFDNQNTLQSGDSIDGGAGTDTLLADLGTSNKFAITPETKSVEIVKFRVQAEGEDGGEGNTSGAADKGATIDAERMQGVKEFWSSNSRADLKVVTQRQPSEAELNDLLFAWTVAKHVKSNAIVYARDLATVGIGAGQMSRVDSTKIASIKAQAAGLSLAGSVVASDAFFPFRDGLDVLAEAGATAVIQPGGSMRDEEVIAAADEHGIAMVFTGARHFRH